MSISTSISKATETVFGQLKDGRNVKKFILNNANGLTLEVMEYGAAVLKILAYDKFGKLEDVTLGFDNLQDYEECNDAYFGVCVGRVCNRIANGKFHLDGKEFQLACNNGQNHLHGGKNGFSKKLWNGSIVDQHKVKFTLTSADGDDGYPGELSVSVCYSLSSDNMITIEFEATVKDKPTIISLTNHTYFNLDGVGAFPDVLNHSLQISASKYLPIDENSIPTGIKKPVENTPFDFTTIKTIGETMKSLDGTDASVGYDHNFCLNQEDDTKLKACLLGSNLLMLEVYTNQPGIQLYTGNYLDGIKGKNNVTYKKHAGLCLETQYYPNAINTDKFCKPILVPGELYHSKTEWRFSHCKIE